MNCINHSLLRVSIDTLATGNEIQLSVKEVLISSRNRLMSMMVSMNSRVQGN